MISEKPLSNPTVLMFVRPSVYVDGGLFSKDYYVGHCPDYPDEGIDAVPESIAFTSAEARVTVEIESTWLNKAATAYPARHSWIVVDGAGAPINAFAWSGDRGEKGCLDCGPWEKWVVDDALIVLPSEKRRIVLYFPRPPGSANEGDQLVLMASGDGSTFHRCSSKLYR